MAQDNPKTTEKIQVREDLQPPKYYNVIFLNDNVTTMDFVIAILLSVFNYSDEDALTMTQKIHEQDSAVVATYPYEIAEQKALETTLLARNNNFPLMVKIEADN